MTTSACITLAAVCIATGVTLLYLASPNQRMCTTPLPPRAARIPGTLLLVAGLVLWCQPVNMLTGVFSALTLGMLLAVALPYLGAWRAPKNGMKRAR